MDITYLGSMNIHSVFSILPTPKMHDSDEKKRTKDIQRANLIRAGCTFSSRFALLLAMDVMINAIIPMP